MGPIYSGSMVAGNTAYPSADLNGAEAREATAASEVTFALASIGTLSEVQLRFAPQDGVNLRLFLKPNQFMTLSLDAQVACEEKWISPGCSGGVEAKSVPQS